MAGRTKLYQQAKSPLIQGHSKYARPAWQPWLAATLLGGLVALAGWVGYVYYTSAGEVTLASWWPPIIGMFAGPVLLGAALGSWLSVWLSGQMGWRRRLLGATLVAIVAGGLAGLIALLAIGR